MFERLQQAHRDASERGLLRRLVDDCRKLLTERGESNSVAIASRAIESWRSLPPDAMGDFFGVLAEEFDPDPTQILALAQQYAQSQSPQSLTLLLGAVEPPRQELLRRLNRAPEGTATIVRMRTRLLERLRQDRRLAAVDADFAHLLSSWFSPGFLRLEQVDWNSPARLLDKIIEHEAVHQIDGWDDLRRRLEPDRRCFAFFHPALPGEPLIFVEVALLDEMPDAIAPLLDRAPSALAGGDRFTVAAFYSISNCQPGLRGVNLGNFLIKQVAEQLRQQFPRLRTFCTLSPVPSLADWIARAGALAPGDADSAVDAEAVRRLCARYLLHTTSGEAGGSDPVARFHLNNGARLERINVSADLSSKGLRQSHGVMVNYLYDLDHIEANHERFVNGQVAASRAVRALA